MNKEIAKNLIKWANGDQAEPYFLYMSLTRKCNLNCLMCGRRNLKPEVINPKNELNEKEIVDIILQASELGIKRVDIGCLGEPFSVPKKTMTAMKKIKESGMKGWIVTNGTLITKENLKLIVDIKWDDIVFSLHGPDAETHDKIVCKEGAFEKMTKNIEILSKLKEKNGSTKPKIVIGYVLTNKNYDKIEETLKLSKKIGVNAFIIQPLAIHDEVGKDLKLDRENRKRIATNLDELISLANAYEIENNFQETNNIIQQNDNIPKIIETSVDKGNGDFFSIPCFSPWLKICINAEGFTHPCSVLWNEKGENIRNKRLKDMWKSEYFEKYRKTLESGKLLEKCKSCCATMALDMSILPRKILND